MDFVSAACRLQPGVVDLRRALHRRPELGNHLPATRATVLDALAGIDLDITLHDTTSGIVAVLDPGRTGPAVLLRADMDALPLREDTELDFASEIDGVMHACGHDLHTAMLVGAIRLMAANDHILGGPVVCMFQPGEEGDHGARFMLDEGLLSAVEPGPTGAFAIHVTSAFPSGTVNHRPGPQMASADTVDVVVHGRGGHASSPFRAADPIPAAAQIVTTVQAALTRSLNPFDPAVVTFARMSAGTTANVIPPLAELEGTMRTFSVENRAGVQDLIRRVAGGVAAAHGLKAEVAFTLGYPVTVNDVGYAGFVDGVAAAALGAEWLTPMANPLMGAEDFSYVLERVPGVITFLGACPPDLTPGEAPSNHSNLVRFDEAAMVHGVALYSAVAAAHGAGGVDPGE